MPRAHPLPPAERRQSLIAATEPLLLRYGSQLSTRQIAEAAGVAEGTLFRVFESKDELVEATVASVLDPQRTVAELARIDPSDDLQTRLIAATAVLQHRMERFMSLFGVLAAHHRHRPAPTADFLAERRRENELLLAALVAVIEPDRDRLRVPPLEVARLLQALSMSARHPVMDTDVRHRNPAQLVDLLLHGVAEPAVLASPYDYAASAGGI